MGIFLCIMLTIDIILFILLGVAALVGWRMGLVQQVFSLLGFGAALVLAWMLCESVAPVVTRLFATAELTSKVIAFVMIVLLATILLSWIAAMLTHLLDGLKVGVVNNLLGMVASVAKYGLVLGFVLKLLVYVGTISEEDQQQSLLVKPLTEVASMVM